MRKVTLTMDEQKKYEVIKSLVDHEKGNKRRAALELGCSLRHINRMIKGYKEQGKAFFVHGNRGRKPATTIPDNVRQQIILLYQTRYYGANFKHYTELLASQEGIYVSVTSVTHILEKEYILSPMTKKAKRKRINKQLKAQLETAKNAKKPAKIADIEKKLIAIDNPHSRRPRCAYMGELIQMDGSPHLWFGDEKTTLHVAIDDATGMITGAWFDKEETLNGYYHVLHQTLTNFGIPYKIFTDRRSVFTYNSKKSPSIDEDSHTQFGYACKQLGIAMDYSSIPQAKGRVERLNGTLQSRLPIELRLRGVTTINEANEFLTHYVKEFNEKFALHSNHIKSVFELQPSTEKINLILAILAERTVDCGHSIKFQNKYYRLINKDGNPVYYRQGTKVMTIRAYDGNLYCCVNDTDVYSLEEIPKHECKSKDLDLDYEKPKQRKRYIPPMEHPWKRASFLRFVRSQQHHRTDRYY